MRPYLELAALPAKMAATAAFVLVVARAAEQAGPLIGAMAATLPVAAAPAYLLLALDHDAAFIAASALASLAANAANVVFCLVHAVVAQSRGLAPSLLAALAAWTVLAVVFGTIEWTLPPAILLNLVVFALCLPLSKRFLSAAMPMVRRRWYDAPLRALLVAALVAAVVSAGTRLGPQATGTLALFPIVLTSLVLMLQPRIGGPATAALTANGIAGLAGYAVALVALHVAVEPLGTPTALILALALSLGWNLSILLLRRRKAR
jgi:hypothetical protein